MYFPKPFSAPVARLLRGKYVAFNKGARRKGAQHPMQFSSGRAKYVVDWELAAGDQVVFNYKHLFGFTDNIRLKSFISLRISTLLFGKIVFHVAECTGGTGHLLLTTSALEGDWIPGTDQFVENVDAALPHRLVAWQAHTRFRVANRLTLGSVINDSFNIVRLQETGSPPGRMLVEKPREYAIPLAGMFRYFKRLLWPF